MIGEYVSRFVMVSLGAFVLGMGPQASRERILAQETPKHQGD